jgi:hypothetical protein
MICYTDTFLKNAKNLTKKFKLFENDLKNSIAEITDENNFGTELGFNLYKKRIKNSSIPTGKSGGFRVIIKKEKDRILLVTIYSKTQTQNINIDDIRAIVNRYLKNYI